MLKRAQQALEFMMQYGWAFIVLAAGFAALAYFGVFTPGDVTVSKCQFGAGIGCRDFKATDTTVLMTLTNAFPEELTALTITFEELGSCTAAVTPDQGQTWSAANCSGSNNSCTFAMTSGTVINANPIGVFSFTNCPIMSRMAVIPITITYRTTGAQVDNQVTGKADLKIEE